MSTITLTVTSTALVFAGSPLTVTASVTNSASVPARVTLAAFAPAAEAGSGTASPEIAQGWTAVERPIREIAPQATEQFTVTVTPPAAATTGDHTVRLIAYDSDRAPEEYSDQAQQLRITIPAAPVPPPKPAWWIWAAAAALVLIVGTVAFFVLRPTADAPLPPAVSTTSTSIPPTTVPTSIPPTSMPPTTIPPSETATGRFTFRPPRPSITLRQNPAPRLQPPTPATSP